ncbi:MAG: alpha/beta hydrolase [Reyranella sp.]|jgi:2-(acetamidomethylene)succinate hydrolase|nr:alpha/beta hydrolase [Reyranella sp.]
MDVSERECRLGAVTLHTIAAGKGPLAVLLHGITANAYVFLPLMRHLADHFHVVAVDMRGHGRSSKPATGYAATDYARDIEALIRHLGGGPALLIGHALGARDAFVAGARDNGLVTGVVGIDFTPFIEPAAFEALGRRISGGNRLFADVAAIEQALAERYPRMPADAIRRRAQYGYVRVDDGWRPLAALDAMLQTAAGMRESFEAAFVSLKVPTLLIRGADSKFVSPDVWARTRMLRPDMRMVELPDADHYAAEEIPGPIAREIVSFWQRDVQRDRPA